MAWNQWPEVVGREPRQPRFVGDMPHGWVASDFIRAALDLFAYEREHDEALVLAAGVPARWLHGEGVRVRELRTPYGRLSYHLKKEEGHVVLHVEGGSQAPPGGFVLAWPGSRPPGDTRVNGRVVHWHGEELRFHDVPATVTVRAEP